MSGCFFVVNWLREHSLMFFNPFPDRPISHNKSSRQPSQVVNEILDVMQEEQQPRVLPDTNMSIDLSCEFFGISTRSMD